MASPHAKLWTSTTMKCRRRSKGWTFHLIIIRALRAKNITGLAQDFFLKLLDQGSFEVKTEAQFYDSEADQFLADRYITGTCPKCEAPGAYGDQCEKCGTALSPTDLIDPQSTLSGATPELKDTTLWYLPMGRHEGWLKSYIETGELNGGAHHDASAWKAHVTGQCRSWIDSGLQSRAMTRDLDWGVPVPVGRRRRKGALRLVGCPHWLYHVDHGMGRNVRAKLARLVAIR